jgi:hypothetical protein
MVGEVREVRRETSPTEEENHERYFIVPGNYLENNRI